LSRSLHGGDAQERAPNAVLQPDTRNCHPGAKRWRVVELASVGMQKNDCWRRVQTARAVLRCDNSRWERCCASS